MGKVNCAVIGCRNSTYRLNKWKKSSCTIHSNQTKEVCGCEKPFRMFSFPGPKRFHGEREIWINLIRRVSKENKPWRPCSSDRVCSEHFVEGFPTEKHPDPILKMGYKVPEKCKSRRTLVKFSQPVARKPSLKSIQSLIYQAEEKTETGREASCSVLPGLESEHSYSMGKHQVLCESCVDKNSVILSLRKKIDILTKENDLLKMMYASQ